MTTQPGPLRTPPSTSPPTTHLVREQQLRPQVQVQNAQRAAAPQQHRLPRPRRASRRHPRERARRPPRVAAARGAGAGAGGGGGVPRRRRAVVLLRRDDGEALQRAPEVEYGDLAQRHEAVCGGLQLQQQQLEGR